MINQVVNIGRWLGSVGVGICLGIMLLDSPVWADVNSVEKCQVTCLSHFIDCLEQCDTQPTHTSTIDTSCFSTCNNQANDCFLSDCAPWNLKEPIDFSVIDK